MLAEAFVLFGPSHLAAIALTAVLSAALIAWVRSAGPGRATRAVAWTLAAALVLNRVLIHVLEYADGDLTWRGSLPLDPCDLSNFLAAIALVWRARWSYELTYFWTLAGALPGLLTPDLQANFPSPWFIAFVIAHGGPVTAVAVLTLGMKMRPQPGSIVRAAGWLVVWMLAAAGVNWLTGGNYGYLAHAPAHGTIINGLGPWPWYIAALAAIGIGLMLLWYAPFFVKDRVRKRREASASQQ
ncbi:MAG: hypothetical protein BIFFINMI_01859 [Phycisphaerae bacterium]|nr:hypothetical protein [Phycisphaerae bacterium]